MSLFGEKERQAVEYVADRVEDFEYSEQLAKTGTVAGLAGAGAALSTNNVGLSALSFAVGNFSHNVSTELASRNNYDELLDDMTEGEIDDMIDENLYRDMDDTVDVDDGDYDIEKHE